MTELVSKQCIDQIKKLLDSKEPVTFNQLKNLKSGRDGYSKMRYLKLSQQVTQEDLRKIKSKLRTNSLVCRAIRWNLRGLTVDMAILRVFVDLKVRQDAIEARMKEKAASGS